MKPWILNAKASSTICGAVLTVLTIVAPSANAEIISSAQWKAGPYTFDKMNFNWNNDFGAKLKVSRGERQLLQRQNHDVWVWTKKVAEDDADNQPKSSLKRAPHETLTECEEADKLKLVDLNNDGIKDFVVRQWSGGAHCCYKYEIFSLAKDCPRMWYLDAGNGHLNVTERPGNSAVLEVDDGTFVGWDIITAGNDRPMVYLTWNDPRKQQPRDTTPHINWKLQHKPIDRKRYAEMKAKPLDSEKESYFIQLIYAGQNKAAHELLESAPQADRERFLKSFLTQFRKSAFYQEIMFHKDSLQTSIGR